jgi:hypothetical protein
LREKEKKKKKSETKIVGWVEIEWVVMEGGGSVS